MAAGFCLPNKYIMVDVCCSGYTNYADCIINSKFSINKSSNRKSCKEFENGVANLKIKQFENLKMVNQENHLII